MIVKSELGVFIDCMPSIYVCIILYCDVCDLFVYCRFMTNHYFMIYCLSFINYPESVHIRYVNIIKTKLRVVVEMVGQLPFYIEIL